MMDRRRRRLGSSPARARGRRCASPADPRKPFAEPFLPDRLSAGDAAAASLPKRYMRPVRYTWPPIGNGKKCAIPGPGSSVCTSSSGHSGSPTESTVPASGGAPPCRCGRRPPRRQFPSGASMASQAPPSAPAQSPSAGTTRRAGRGSGRGRAAGCGRTRPSRGVAFELVVPVVGAREPAVHDAHDAGAAGARLDASTRSRPAGPPGMSSLVSATKRCGGVPRGDRCRPSPCCRRPKCETAVPPSRSSTSLGTNQDEMPGPVAIACQTSSGVPGTSTSAWTERRPDASFFTGMTAPFWRLAAGDGRRPPAGARGRPAPRVVVAGDQRRDRPGELVGERGALRGRAEPDLGVDRQRRQPLVACARAAPEIADLADDARGERDQVARGQPVGGAAADRPRPGPAPPATRRTTRRSRPAAARSARPSAAPRRRARARAPRARAGGSSPSAAGGRAARRAPRPRPAPPARRAAGSGPDPARPPRRPDRRSLRHRAWRSSH